jgi:hypothetical protein
MLAEQVSTAATHRFPYQWQLYEVSYKSQRYIHRGHGKRSPVDEYHVAFDRPPRGAGILIGVSGTEQAVLVGLQLWGVRKSALQRLWYTQPAVWQPLVEQLAQAGDIRFRKKPPSSTSPNTDSSWMETYLGSRSANYLWAGFVYPWDDFPPDLDSRIVDNVLTLFPLNEALMEQAEMGKGAAPQHIRETRSSWYAATEVPDIATISEHIRAQSVAMRDTIIRAYHVALKTRPLVILTGISGTGKTMLTRLYADAIHHIPSSAHENPYYLLVAVQPDWHNARDLLGYYNALSNTYHTTPLLRFLMHAAADPQQHYYVCLDEMNLARPEYYLAPLLSAYETTERLIDLGIPTTEVQTMSGETLRNPFRLPLNVSFSGTVNVDESTCSLSDKLLDRANVIELTDVDMPAFLAVYTESRGQPPDPWVWEMLCQVQTLVTQSGQPYGYRTLKEIVQYIEHAMGVMPVAQALDLQIKQKILPKVRGEESPYLRQTLHDLRLLLEEADLTESAAKVQRMLDRLRLDGFTDFYS